MKRLQIYQDLPQRRAVELSLVDQGRAFATFAPRRAVGGGVWLKSAELFILEPLGRSIRSRDKSEGNHTCRLAPQNGRSTHTSCTDGFPMETRKVCIREGRIEKALKVYVATIRQNRGFLDDAILEQAADLLKAIALAAWIEPCVHHSCQTHHL